jgi:hypothetical protein
MGVDATADVVVRNAGREGEVEVEVEVSARARSLVIVLE